MTLSQNGWAGITSGSDPRLADFPWVTGKVRGGDVWTVLNHVAKRFNAEVEPIVKAKSWGWAYRAIRGATALSNHASGTAVDFNAPYHWLGEVGTFTPAQVRAIRSILADCGGVVRWGGDYSGRKDEMHFEINLGAAGSAAKVAAVAAKIKGDATTVSTKPSKVLALGVANCQSYDGDKSAAAWLARGRLMAAQGRNVWAVTETTPEGRTALLAALGANWKVWTLDGKSVAVLFDGAVWQWRKIRKAGPWSPFGHGSAAVPLIHRASRWGVDVIAHHTRPASIASDAEKDQDIAAGAKLSGKWPVVMAGDFARNAPKLVGWVRATTNVDTMDKAGDQRVDAAFVRGLTASNARVIDPGPLSDHKWLTVDLTPTTSPTL